MRKEKNQPRVEKGLSEEGTLVLEHVEIFRRKAHLEPEQRLLLAVLEDAVACFQKHVVASGGRRRRIFCEVEEWFLEENSERLFSFENTCEAVGINPGYLRQGLLRWKETRTAQQVKAKAYESTSGNSRAAFG